MSRGTFTAQMFGDFESTSKVARRPGLLFLAVGVAGAVIMLFRTPIPQWNILWAEDGAVFVSGALQHDPSVILQPYSGYIHIVARLAAAGAAVFPIDVVPLATTIIAAVIGGALSAAVFSFARQRLTSPITPYVVWLSFVALPTAGGEVANTLANLHWYLLFTAFWALIVRAHSRGMLVAQSLVVAAALLSDPLALLLLPLVVLRALFLPAKRERILLLVFALAGMAQIAGSVVGTLVDGGRTWSISHPSPRELVDFYTIRVALDAVVGVRLTGSAMSISHLYLALVIAVVVLLILAMVISRSHRIPIALFALASVSAASLLYYLQWDNLGPVGALKLDQGDRYSVDAVLLLLSSMIFSWDSIVTRLVRPSLGVVVGVAALLLVAAPAVIDYRVWNVRADAPPWQAALDRAAADCAAGRDQSGLVHPAIAPSFIGGPAISCSILKDR